MNREIKFRFWDNQINVMIYIDFKNLCSGEYYIEDALISMQYTGVYDTTEDEIQIYEGDNIKFKYKGTEYIGEVKFKAGAFMLCNDELPYTYIPFLEIISCYRGHWWIDGEVIGNIYEDKFK